jgi:hypothetical protein
MENHQRVCSLLPGWERAGSLVSSLDQKAFCPILTLEDREEVLEVAIDHLKGIEELHHFLHLLRGELPWLLKQREQPTLLPQKLDAWHDRDCSP